MDDVTEREMQGDAPQLMACPCCHAMIWTGSAMCVHCGYPFAGDAVTKEKRPASRSRAKFRKRKNGYGSIQEVKSAHLRRPFRVIVTVGHSLDASGKYKQERRCLGYYETREAAEKALNDFLRSPYDADGRRLTFSQVYDMYMGFAGPSMAANTKRGKATAYGHAAPLHDLPMSEIKLFQLQLLFDDMAADGCSFIVLNQLKTMLSGLFEYALNMGIVEKDLMPLVTVAKHKNNEAKKTVRSVFTTDELKALAACAAKGDKAADVAIFLVATGLRVSELYNLRCDDLDMQARTLTVTKSKTSSGLRTIPWPDSISQLVARWYGQNVYLFYNAHGNRWVDDNFRKSLWRPLMEKLGMSHEPHDCRHSYSTMLAQIGTPVAALDRLSGHAAGNTSIDTYSAPHLDIEYLRGFLDKAFPPFA